MPAWYFLFPFCSLFSLQMTLTKPVQPRALSEEGLGRLRRALFRSSRYSGKIQNFGVRSSCVSLSHTWMIVVLAKQIGWMLSFCKSVVEDMYLQRLEIVTPTWLRIGWTYVGLTLSLLSPTWSCLLDLRR